MNFISSFLYSIQTPNAETLKKGNIPGHVGIIMDGNGRWAARRNLPRVMGHRAGVESLRQVIKTSVEVGVKHLTVFAFSSENWDRPKNEVNFLMELFVDCLQKELESLNSNGVKIKIIGERDKSPKEVMDSFRHAEKVTENNRKMVFSIAFNYGSRQEIINAAKNICKDFKNKKLDMERLDENIFSGFLYTRGCPDPDLIIRTSGEYRISNFLLWQSAYAEFYFTRTLWPDFSRSHYLKAIRSYQKRNRRFGRV
ncbi:MAG: isoprenyl transferase [Actinomycetota bacterium]